MGSGPTLVVLPLSLTISDFQGFDERMQFAQLLWTFGELATSFRVVTYDHLGAGLSDREGYDYSPAGLREELDAALLHESAQRLAIMGTALGVHTAIRYAITHPERIACLVMNNLVWPKGSDYVNGPAAALLSAVRESDWEVGSEYYARLQMGARERSATMASWIRATTERDTYLEYVNAIADSDVSSVLPEVRAPTLVIQSLSHVLYPVEALRTVASAIPVSRLAVTRDREHFFATLREFLMEHSQSEDDRHPSAMHCEPTAVLSAREQEVLALIALGSSNADIAQELVIAEATAARHVHNILTKLGVANRTEAAARWGARRGH